MGLYCIGKDATEAEIVAVLMEWYKAMAGCA